jgi:hypothetical protein
VNYFATSLLTDFDRNKKQDKAVEGIKRKCGKLMYTIAGMFKYETEEFQNSLKKEECCEIDSIAILLSDL